MTAARQAQQARLLRSTADALSAPPPIIARAVMPNMSWLEFVSGDLTPADWSLIARVERGEITTAQAMAEQHLFGGSNERG